MTEQEIQEIFALLDAQGLHPRLCDTPVPYYDNGVPCGNPNDIGSSYPDDYYMLPHDLVGRNSIIIIHAVGDSMVDAGIEDGDEVHVQLDAPIRDGDQVVVCINGESTLKSYYRDDEGHPWLVPCNEKYDPIEITEDMDVRLLGKVVRCVKSTMSTPFRYMQQSVRRLKVKRAESGQYVMKTYTEDDLRRVLREVFGEAMVAAADWVAVYRILVDKCGAPVSHTAFAEWINALDLGEYPPCSRDHLRKADPIYFRPLFEWTTDNINSASHDRRVALAKRLKQLL